MEELAIVFYSIREQQTLLVPAWQIRGTLVDRLNAFLLKESFSVKCREKWFSF